MNLEQAEQIVMSLWSKDAAAWRKYWVPIFRRFAKDLIYDSDISQGQLVLDIGTGTGVAAFEAARRVKWNGFVFGIDRLESMLAAGRAEPEARRFRNVRFFLMDAQKLLFPNQIFDSAISNCGISPVGFRQTVAQVYRVLRNGGTFAYSDWHLKDVRAHRIFSEILQQYRTKNPSKKLRLERAALATLERFSNREMNFDEQVRALKMVGFERAEVKTRNYRIALDGIQEYLDMRLKRAPLKQELKELRASKQRELLCALRDELTQFVRGRRFLFEWKVTFVTAKKT
jgi:ubiquinone/menaquinone biosynthesis C-methylase UbiE